MSLLKKIIIISLFLIGVALILYPNFTDLYYSYNQKKMLNEMKNTEPEEINILPDETSQSELENDYVMRLSMRDQRIENAKIEKENALEAMPDFMFVLEIPKIDLETIVLKGTSVSNLRKATGFYTMSAMPGEGNTAIAGHRNTYGHPFRKVNNLTQGDEILLTYKDNVFVYKVDRVFIVANNDWSVIDPTEKSVLTLTTCHPIGTSDQRMIVRSNLDRVVPK